MRLGRRSDGAPGEVIQGARAARLGAAAPQWVQERFLDDRQLCDWAHLYEGLAPGRAT